MPKLSITCKNTVHYRLWCNRQKAKCLLRLNHDCHLIICRASLLSATAVGTKEYTWLTNWWIIFMYFLEYCLKNVIFRYLVNPMQNQMRSTKWHSAINRSISAFKAVFPKLCAAAYWCAAEEAEVCRESFMFSQNLMLQIFLVRIALLWVLTFHLKLG